MTSASITDSLPKRRMGARRKRRLILIGSGVAALGAAMFLVMFALRDAFVYYRTPTELSQKAVPAGTRIRLGGLVKASSVVRGQGHDVRFEVTDQSRSVPVAYTGLLPDLFREGQGVVAEGVLLADGSFRADSILAKHDETYMPREVAETLKKQGHWQGEKTPQGETAPAR